MIWIAGLNTSRLENGSEVSLNGLFAVTGNKTYDTANGSNTVLVLELINVEAHEERFTRRDEIRTWTSKSGHTTEAIFAGYERRKVKLMNLQEKTKEVRLTDLTDEDRKYVRQQLRAAADNE